MNILENFIVEIHSVEEIERQNWMQESYVKVDMTTNCYGCIKRQQLHFPISEWETVKKAGYYLG